MAWLAAVGTWVGAHAATIGMAASVVGTAISAFSSIQAGRQQKAASRYNAKMQMIQAERERSAKLLEERRHRQQSTRLLARQRSLYLKAGVALEGTPLEVIGQTAAESEIDAMIIRATGKGRYLDRLTMAGMLKKMGKEYETAGYLRAGSTLLTGVGQTMIGYGGIPAED